MSQISASEKRLIAALDRIDYSIEQARGTFERARTGNGPAKAASGAVPDADAMAKLREDNDRLSAELARLTEEHAEALATLNRRLSGAGAETARLVEANDALAAANHALTEGAPGAGAQALQAEIAALQAARDAEMGQLSEIIAALEDMLGIEARTTPPAKPAVAAVTDTQANIPPAKEKPGVAASDSTQPDPHTDEGEKPSKDSPFGAVYGDGDADDEDTDPDDDDED